LMCLGCDQDHRQDAIGWRQSAQGLSGGSDTQTARSPQHHQALSGRSSRYHLKTVLCLRVLYKGQANALCFRIRPSVLRSSITESLLARYRTTQWRKFHETLLGWSKFWRSLVKVKARCS